MRFFQESIFELEIFKIFRYNCTYYYLSIEFVYIKVTFMLIIFIFKVIKEIYN